MLWMIVGLMGFSFVLLLVSGGVLLIFLGRTRHQTRHDVGRNVMDGISEEPLGHQASHQKSFFIGQGISVSREATISFATLKHRMAAGDWPYTLVALTAILGFMGVLCFLAILVLFLMPNLLGFIFALVIFAQLIRMVIDFIRA